MAGQAKIFKALSCEARLKIIRLLKEHPQCVNAIAVRLRMTQPAVSQHLRLLREAGLVRAVKRGNWMHYSMDRRTIEGQSRAMADIFGGWIKFPKEGNGTRNCPRGVLAECPGRTPGRE